MVTFLLSILGLILLVSVSIVIGIGIGAYATLKGIGEKLNETTNEEEKEFLIKIFDKN